MIYDSIMAVADLIKEWLEDESHGRRDLQFLADRSGISRALLSRISTGDRRVTPEAAVKLGPALGKTKLEMLTLIGLISPKELAGGLPGKPADPAILDLCHLLQQYPDRAKQIAPLLKNLLEEPDHSPGDIQDLVEVLLGLPENQRKGLLMAFGGSG